MPVILIVLILIAGVGLIFVPPALFASAAKYAKVTEKENWGKAWGASYLSLFASLLVGGPIYLILGFLPIPALNIIIGGMVSFIVGILVIKWVYPTSFGKALLTWFFVLLELFVGLLIGGIVFVGGLWLVNSGNIHF
jgi:hypothetical protein